MSHQLSNLVGILFDQLDKLNDPELTGEKLAEQLERTRAVSTISRDIISAGRLGLDAKRARPDMLEGDRLPKMLALDESR
ncbi:MAG: hypothetical protein ACXW04_01225 [Methylobacter sp.]